MIRWPLAAAGILVALVAGYLHGLSRAPTREVEIVAVQRIERTMWREHQEAAASTHEASAAFVGPVKTTKRWTPAPGCPGPIVEEIREEGPREERKEASADQHVTVGKEALLTSTEAAQSTRTVERRDPRWAVGADGGLRFADATAVIRGRFEVRALGPIWLAVWADPSAAGAGARLEW